MRVRLVTVALPIALVLAHAAFVRAMAPGKIAGQANDLCPDAQVIGGEGVFSFDNGAAASDGPTHEACATARGAGIDQDVWFCWTSPCDGPVTVDTTRRTTVDTKLAVYRGCNCPPSDESVLGCNDDTDVYQSEVTFDAAVGESYLIRLGTHPGLGGGTGTFRIRCGEGEGPICTSYDAGVRTWDAFNSTRGQYVIADRQTPREDEIVSEIYWSGAYLNGIEDCAGHFADDFEVRYYADDCGRPGELWAGPFRQSDATLTMTDAALSCSTLDGAIPYYVYTAEHAPVDFLAGVSYWIEITNAGDAECNWFWRATGWQHALQDGAYTGVIDGYDDSDGIGRSMSVWFVLRLAFTEECYGPPRANDECAGASPIGEGETFFSTVGALISGPPVPTCDFSLDNDQISYDLWYDYVAPCTGVVTLDVCDATFDTKLAVYEQANCADVDRVVACNDDACGDEVGRQSSMTFSVQSGLSYKVRVGNSPAAYRIGTGTLYLNFEPQPPAKSDLFDHAELMRCFTGACPISPCDPPLYGEACCGSYDFDADGDVDAQDYLAAHGGLVGPGERSKMCGNGIVEAGEECDDGNSYSGDGCDEACQLEFIVANDDCAHAATITDGETPFDTWDATSGGRDVPGCALPVHSRVDHDIWYRYTPTCVGRVYVELCDTDFDSRAVVYVDGPCDELTPVACDDEGCTSDGALVSFGASPYLSYLIRIGGMTDIFAPAEEDRSRGHGIASVTCREDVCGSGTSCFVEHETPGCGDRDCCNSVCTKDVRCCDVAWDYSCVELARVHCPR